MAATRAPGQALKFTRGAWEWHEQQWRDLGYERGFRAGPAELAGEWITATGEVACDGEYDHLPPGMEQFLTTEKLKAAGKTLTSWGDIGPDDKVIWVVHGSMAHLIPGWRVSCGRRAPRSAPLQS